MGDRTWILSLFSRSSPDASADIIHAGGNVALLASDNAKGSKPTPIAQATSHAFAVRTDQELARRDWSQRKYHLQDFRKVVDYATYYRGVKKVFAKDQEVVGRVSVPSDQPLNLTPGCCNPIAIDNFLQVAGIHVNCLSDCNDDEVFVCTAIRKLSLSDKLSQHQADDESWIVYSNIEPASERCVVNDVLVLDSRSGELVLTLMGAQFTSIPLRSLEKSFSRLNDVYEKMTSVVNRCKSTRAPFKMKP